MATLNLSSNGPLIKSSYQKIVDAPAPSGPAASSPTYGQWAVYSVQAPLVSAFQQDSGKESVLRVQSTGEGELADLIDDFSEGRIQFAFLKVKDPNSGLPKSVLIAWCGEGVPERTKGYFGSHLAAVSKLLHGYHVQVTARSDRDLTPESIVQKVADASGSNYSGGPTTRDSSSNAAPPPVATKPVFMPNRVGGSGGFNPLASRSRAQPQSQNEDNDGWGADAPEVTRTRLEKVESAYKPTKVNMAELTSQRQEPSRFQATQQSSSNGASDVVKGGYQPIGKVDIAALRKQAQDQGSVKDDRPSIVKGSYEPVGKVDIAAIRAKAQGGPPPAAAQTPSASEEERPQSLSDRSAAFQQSERLTSMPKPKVANRFGSQTSSFAGTTAPAPGGFQAKPLAAAAPVGTASKTFADEGGKTPAQIWAEKKARQRGSSNATEPQSPQNSGSAAPIAGQKSGGWQSGYTGKSWGAVQTTRTGTSAVSADKTGDDQTAEEEDQPSAPSGGVGALKNRFAGAAPMGATRDAGDGQEPVAHPPPMDFSSKPNAGGRGVPMPGLPQRPPQQDDEEDEEAPAEERRPIPPPPQAPGRPDPEEEEEQEEEEEPPSPPARIAMPVSRSAAEEQPELETAEEHYDPEPVPASSLSRAATNMAPEPEEDEDHATGAASTLGAGAAAPGAGPGAGVSGKRALVQFDYEKAEDNEIELREGEYVDNIEMVDEDWWMGQNSQGESGLFPSNYVELVEEGGAAAGGAAGGRGVPAPPDPEEEAAPPGGRPQPAGVGGATATAQYDYEAAEDNELSFPEGARIENVEFPDEDWWMGEYNGKQGLFPSNYVQLDE